MSPLSGTLQTKYNILKENNTESFNNLRAEATALVAKKRKYKDLDNSTNYEKRKKVLHMGCKSKVASNNTTGKEDIPPTLEETTVQNITDEDNKEKKANSWHRAVEEELVATKSVAIENMREENATASENSSVIDIERSGKKSGLVDVALPLNSGEIAIEDTTTSTEGKNIADPNSICNSSNLETSQNEVVTTTTRKCENNPYIATNSNITKNNNDSERDLTDLDLVISDEENLEDLMEAENHEGKDIEIVESGNMTTPLEDKSMNDLEENRIEEVSKIANSKDTEVKATTNTRMDDEGFIKVSYK
ncbi:42988_t:CDS:2 [Gigaspora margarita]|uniref:42988_t:CDS:1 n=1 Tax=Gigaspora margarita TaxID=4874 RepID=A0ABN7W9T7_GIGMA|nr:42988_t:CDS:2 [Gigaspora margarita]